jgi:hypothetical protein
MATRTDCSHRPRNLRAVSVLGLTYRTIAIVVKQHVREPWMKEKTAGGDRFNWRLPIYVALGTSVVSILVAISESDGILYFFVVVPIISVFSFAFLLIAAIKKKPHRCLTILALLVVYWALSFAFLKNYPAIRNAARWSLWSERYKAEVLAQPDDANGGLKHIDWDGWGFPGAGDTTVYLVFDPADSLAAAAKSHQPGKFSGIPCKVPLVSRLEGRWYAVLFYTDERWGKPKRDCGTYD